MFAETVDQPDDHDEMPTRVLDGAYEQFRRIGIRRSATEDVARRAGVSRITVYRRFDLDDDQVRAVARQFLVPVLRPRQR